VRLNSIRRKSWATHDPNGARLRIQRSTWPPILSGALRTGTSSARVRLIFDLSAENVKIEDSLAEGSGFELSVPISKLADDNF